jgi:DNA mismatch endonuclease (patch repair protein)
MAPSGAPLVSSAAGRPHWALVTTRRATAPAVAFSGPVRSLQFGGNLNSLGAKYVPTSNPPVLITPCRDRRSRTAMACFGARGTGTVKSLSVPEPWRQPFASTEAVRLRMSAQRREGTGPEMALRRALHALGLRYRLHRAPLSSLRRKADIVFSREQVAVFVDGCFWHGCPEHGRRRHDTNSWYWPDKIAGNRARDEDTDRLLGCSGWLALRFWEHELTEGGAPGAALRVKAVLEERRLPSARTDHPRTGHPRTGHPRTGHPRTDHPRKDR